MFSAHVLRAKRGIPIRPVHILRWWPLPDLIKIGVQAACLHWMALLGIQLDYVEVSGQHFFCLVYVCGPLEKKNKKNRRWVGYGWSQRTRPILTLIEQCKWTSWLLDHLQFYSLTAWSHFDPGHGCQYSRYVCDHPLNSIKLQHQKKKKNSDWVVLGASIRIVKNYFRRQLSYFWL